MKRKFTNTEIYEFYEKTNPVFYFNKKDSNIIVPKYSKNRMRKGLGLNFANPKSYIIILGILSAVYSIIFLFL